MISESAPYTREQINIEQESLLSTVDSKINYLNVPSVGGKRVAHPAKIGE